MIKIKRFDLVLFSIGFILFISMILPSLLQAQQSHTISGQVYNTGGIGIDGVTICFFDGISTDYETTSGGGYYSHTVYAGWTGTITPGDDCYSFIPASPPVGPVTEDTVQNFTGTLLTYTLSGFVSDGPPVFDGGGTLTNPVSGALITLSTGGTTISGPDGSYSLAVDCGWTGTVTPTMVGWEFSPSSRYYEWVDNDYTGNNFVGTASGVIYDIPTTTELGKILFLFLMGTVGVLYLINGQKRGGQGFHLE